MSDESVRRVECAVPLDIRPGVQSWRLSGFRSREPPRNWTSSKPGNPDSLRIDSGDWPWTITPLLRLAIRTVAVSHKAVFDAQDVVGERGFVEKVSKRFLNAPPYFVVTHLDQAVLDTDVLAKFSPAGNP